MRVRVKPSGAEGGQHGVLVQGADVDGGGGGEGCGVGVGEEGG